jgi:hypothetical protein
VLGGILTPKGDGEPQRQNHRSQAACGPFVGLDQMGLVPASHHPSRLRRPPHDLPAVRRHVEIVSADGSGVTKDGQLKFAGPTR